MTKDEKSAYYKAPLTLEDSIVFFVILALMIIIFR